MALIANMILSATHAPINTRCMYIDVQMWSQRHGLRPTPPTHLLPQCPLTPVTLLYHRLTGGIMRTCWQDHASHLTPELGKIVVSITTVMNREAPQLVPTTSSYSVHDVPTGILPGCGRRRDIFFWLFSLINIVHG